MHSHVRILPTTKLKYSAGSNSPETLSSSATAVPILQGVSLQVVTDQIITVKDVDICNIKKPITKMP